MFNSLMLFTWYFTQENVTCDYDDNNSGDVGDSLWGWIIEPRLPFLLPIAIDSVRDLLLEVITIGLYCLVVYIFMPTPQVLSLRSDASTCVHSCPSSIPSSASSMLCKVIIPQLYTNMPMMRLHSQVLLQLPLLCSPFPSLATLSPSSILFRQTMGPGLAKCSNSEAQDNGCTCPYPECPSHAHWSLNPEEKGKYLLTAGSSQPIPSFSTCGLGFFNVPLR